MNPPDFDWKGYLEECMRSTEYCCIATVDRDGVWSNPVYFAWDRNICLYFISQPHARHMKNIARDPRTAVSIYNTGQSAFGDVSGIQLEGRAKILTAKEDVDHAYATYYSRKHPDTGRNAEEKNEDAYMNNPEWLFVEISPEHVYYFDTRHFGEERKEVPRQALARES